MKEMQEGRKGKPGKRFVTVLVLVVFLLGGIAAQAGADWKDILKKGIGVIGGGFLVKTIAGPLNDLINTVTFNKGVKVEGHTKVVPIVSVGEGLYIGAAQVAGPKGDAVESCKAVAQLEVSYQDKARAYILVPIDSENPVQRFRRVQGVGVTAVIDVQL